MSKKDDKKSEKRGKSVRVLVPDPNGPRWEKFPELDRNSVIFSTSIEGRMLTNETLGAKLIVNPNAMIMIEFIGDVDGA